MANRTTRDKNWLSHNAEDIVGKGLGTAGWLFFGDFDGISESREPFTQRAQSLPSYFTAVEAGANFSSVVDEFTTVPPGYELAPPPFPALQMLENRPRKSDFLAIITFAPNFVAAATKFGASHQVTSDCGNCTEEALRIAADSP